MPVRPADHLSFVLGGARSGKSRYALGLAMQETPPWVYIATAQGLDDEMRARIAAHRAERGANWRTIEAPLELARAIADAFREAPVVIDCLTLWLSNLMLGGHDIDAATRAVLDALAARTAVTIAVANEVGLGIVPETPLGRAFRDKAGALNQRLAASAARVTLMVAGVPIQVK